MHSRRWLMVILLVSAAAHLFYGASYPAPPHSSHDAFLLIPQFQKVLLGYVPSDVGLGMFHPSWFNGATTAGGWELFGDLLLDNNRGRHWTQLPHPVALAAMTARWVPSWLSVQLVYLGYLCVTLLSLYGIGLRLGGERVGLVAAAAAAGFPGVFGFARYLECHLPVAALCTLVVWLLICSAGLTRWGWCLAVSLVTWSLTRSGEGAADLVAAGLVLAGPAFMTAFSGWRAAWTAPEGRRAKLQRWGVGLAIAVIPLVWLSDLAWIQGALVQILTAFRDPPIQYDVMGAEGGFWEALSFRAAYPILIFSDYLGVCGALLLLVAGLQVRHWPRAGRLLFWVWWLIPLVAFSWMQRKASWYAVATVPPLALAVGFGLARYRAGPWIVGLVSLVQLLGGSFVDPAGLPDAVQRIRQPVPAESWRLRRVELLRPSATEDMVWVTNRVREVLSALEATMPRQGELIQLGLLSRGYQYDYVVRYLLTVARPDIEVISVGDSALRRAGFQGLDPKEIQLWLYVGDGFNGWPPPEADLQWMREDLRCGPDDPIVSFVQSVLLGSWGSVGVEESGIGLYQRGEEPKQTLQQVVLCAVE